MNKEMLKGNIDLMILSILEKEDTYGYEIMKLVSNQAQGIFELKEGTMYISLKRLEKAELVESYWRKVENTPKRKYYKLTSAGKEKLLAMKEEWKQVVSIMNRFVS